MYLETFCIKHQLIILEKKYATLMHQLKMTHHHFISTKMAKYIKEYKNTLPCDRKKFDPFLMDNSEMSISPDKICALHSATQILKIYGYFTKSFPPMREEVGKNTIITPQHKAVQTLIRMLSKKLSAEHKRINNKELPPIGYSIEAKKDKSSVIISSRSNLYEDCPENKKIIDIFMDTYPEYMWYDKAEKLIELGKIKIKENTRIKLEQKKIDRDNNRISKFLPKKIFLLRKIETNTILDKESKDQLINEYNNIVKKCLEEFPSIDEMKDLFRDLREKIPKKVKRYQLN